MNFRLKMFSPSDWKNLLIVIALLTVANRVPGADTVTATYPLMHFTTEQLDAIVARHRLMPLTSAQVIGPRTFAPSINLLPRLSYVPEERNQGACGNCWAWAGTGVMELALSAQNEVKDRLSVQFLNTCNQTRECCEGGWLSDVATFYGTHPVALPWSKPGAKWSGGCALGAYEKISMSPNYPVSRSVLQLISTQSVGQEQAIANEQQTVNAKVSNAR